MRKKLSILFLIFFMFAAEPVHGESPTYRIRLVESVSKTPIPQIGVVLVPRVILIKSKSGAPDPNLEYALKRTTDQKGVFTLTKAQLEGLFYHFKEGSGVVDCRAAGFSRFTIEFNPISNRYNLSLFDRNGHVRNPGGKSDYLIVGEIVEIILDSLGSSGGLNGSR